MTMKDFMKTLAPRYRFVRIFRGYQVGQMVPENFDFGVLDSLLNSNRIERVPEIAPVEDPALGLPRGEPAPTIKQALAKKELEEAEEAKMIEKSPADKMVKPNRKWVKRK